MWLTAWLIFTKTKKEQIIKPTNTFEKPQEIKKEKIKLKILLKDKSALVFISIRFVLDPIFYFYMFWIPKYLNETHSLSLETIGKILWIPFLALGIAHIIGGWLSDLILRKTKNINLARRLVMGIASLLTIPVVFVGFIHSYVVIMVLMSLAFFAHGLWMTNYITSISDLFGKHVTSTVVGLSGSAGALSSLILNPVIGYIVTIYSYNPMWWYAGLMYPVVFVIFLWLIPKVGHKHMAFATA
jgi:ACS family hexuronate transporter-like MFS transporter